MFAWWSSVPSNATTLLWTHALPGSTWRWESTVTPGVRGFWRTS